MKRGRAYDSIAVASESQAEVASATETNTSRSAAEMSMRPRPPVAAELHRVHPGGLGAAHDLAGRRTPRGRCRPGPSPKSAVSPEQPRSSTKGSRSITAPTSPAIAISASATARPAVADVVRGSHHTLANQLADQCRASRRPGRSRSAAGPVRAPPAASRAQSRRAMAQRARPAPDRRSRPAPIPRRRRGRAAPRPCRRPASGRSGRARSRCTGRRCPRRRVCRDACTPLPARSPSCRAARRQPASPGCRS